MPSAPPGSGAHRSEHAGPMSSAVGHRSVLDLPADALAVELLDAPAHADQSDVALARRLAYLGMVGVALAALAIGLLHVIPPSRSLDPVSRTISEYALLSDGWIFDAGVVVLSVSSATILLAMVLRQLTPWRSWGALMTVIWSIGLIGLVVFPKHGFGADQSVAGRVHWTWTLIAFFSLPIGICLLCWQHRLPAPRWPRWALRLSMIAGGWFLLLTGQTFLSLVSHIQAAHGVGLVERGLSLTEMAAVGVLGMWVLHDCRPPMLAAQLAPAAASVGDPANDGNSPL